MAGVMPAATRSGSDGASAARRVARRRSAGAPRWRGIPRDPARHGHRSSHGRSRANPRAHRSDAGRRRRNGNRDDCQHRRGDWKATSPPTTWSRVPTRRCTGPTELGASAAWRLNATPTTCPGVRSMTLLNPLDVSQAVPVTGAPHLHRPEAKVTARASYLSATRRVRFNVPTDEATDGIPSPPGPPDPRS
jgi:hypothetical protein